MQLETFSFVTDSGWSKPFPTLDSEQTLLLAFGAPQFRDARGPLEELRAAYPRARVAGCSSSGEIHGAELKDDSLSVAVVRFERSLLDLARAEVSRPEDSYGAGRALATTLSRDDLRAILVLSDGLGVNGSELVRGLDESLDSSVVVTGGLAGDGARFQRTWVLGERGPTSGLVTAIGLYGERVNVGHGSQGGWEIFGPDRRITRASGNTLFELDGRPALDLYKEYLGPRASGLPATALHFPLSLRSEAGDERNLVRTVCSVDERQHSMTFAGDIPEGWLARLMRASFDRLIEGAANAASQCVVNDARAPASDALSIAISCVGRRLILGERTEEEIEAVLGALPVGTRQVGFYSYGEISPWAPGRSDLHNQTMALTTISES